MVFKRIGREWLVLGVALVGAAFSVGDGAGWIKFLSGYEPTQQQVVAGVFILFAIVVVIRLVKLQTKIDDMRGGVIFTAIPSPLNINLPVANETPLKDDEFYICTTIHFELWTDMT